MGLEDFIRGGLIMEQNSFFQKYGDIKKVIWDNSFFVINSKSSLWLRDLRDFLRSWNVASNWFGRSFSCKLGNDNDIDFWRGYWIDIEPLCLLFHVLFQSLHQPRLRISEVDSRVQNSWSSSFSVILEPVSNYVVVERENLSTIMQHIVPFFTVAGWFVWWSNSNGFSVKTTYSRLYYCVG